MGLLAPVEIDDNIGKNWRILEDVETSQVDIKRSTEVKGAGGLLLKFHASTDYCEGGLDIVTGTPLTCIS